MVRRSQVARTAWIAVGSDSDVGLFDCFDETDSHSDLHEEVSQAIVWTKSSDASAGWPKRTSWQPAD